MKACGPTSTSNKRSRADVPLESPGSKPASKKTKAEHLELPKKTPKVPAFEKATEEELKERRMLKAAPPPTSSLSLGADNPFRSVDLLPKADQNTGPFSPNLSPIVNGSISSGNTTPGPTDDTFNLAFAKENDGASLAFFAKVKVIRQKKKGDDPKAEYAHRGLLSLECNPDGHMIGRNESSGGVFFNMMVPKNGGWRTSITRPAGPSKPYQIYVMGKDNTFQSDLLRAFILTFEGWEATIQFIDYFLTHSVGPIAQDEDLNTSIDTAISDGSLMPNTQEWGDLTS